MLDNGIYGSTFRRVVLTLLSTIIDILVIIVEYNRQNDRTIDHETLKQIIFDQHEVIKKSQIVSRDYVFDKNANYVLIGLRRSGKSTLLYKRVQDLISSGVEWKQIIYINFDDERLLGFQANDFEDILLTAEEITNRKHYF